MWSTELHLGFLQLVKIGGPPPPEESDFDRYAGVKDDDVLNGRQRKFPYSIKGAQFDIFKASLSYRFSGDMGDKFWSGYLMIYLPGASKILPPGGSDAAWDEVEKWFESATKNDQRKILEPYLVEKMTSELFQSTHGILKPIEDWLDPEMDVSKDQTVTKDLTSSKVDDKDFDVQYNRSAMCLELEATLRVLQRLTKSNVTVLDQWSKRESTRHYKPRWSEKDEMKFRKLVDHQKRRAERSISAVKEQLHQIQTSIDQVRNHRQEVR